MTLCPCDHPPQNSQPQSHHKKNIRQIPVEEHPPKCLSGTLQKCQGHQKQGEADKLTAKRSLRR